ncbi:SAM-dependent methyltransferase [Gordonia jacobaea]|uniref:SAM-dependent methyltransferase n=1 Tax=Gordonia jacobaea TaxID=122202 RepID=UPI003D73ADE0
MADLDDLGLTALGVAWARAAESSRDDALFDDPLAEAIARIRPRGSEFGGDDGTDERGSAKIRAMYDWIVARTVFLDEVFAAAVADGITQFVILGSGLDGRGFRLDFGSGAKLFEVDRPSVVEVKEDLVAQSGLAPTVERRVVASDLADDWLRALQGKGFRADLPSAWLAEGLFVYLPDELGLRVIEGITAASESGSRIGVTVRRAASSVVDDSAADPFADVRKLWRSDVDVAQHVDAAGWDCELSDTREVLAAHGRSLSETDGAQESATLLSGVRRQRGHGTIDRS